VTQIIAANSPTPVVPDAYIAIVPPQNQLIAGAAYGRLGIVGTATWGPVGVPVIIGGNDQQLASFGIIQNREYDLGTAVAVSIQQGASDMRCVRATDGTDTAATATIAASTAIETATIGGTITAADKVQLIFTPTYGAAITVSYTVIGTDTTTSTATALLALLQANVALTTAGFTFTSSGAVITMNGPAMGWTYNKNVTGAATETVTLASGTASPTQLTVTAKYTGSAGNGLTIAISAGSKASTFKATVSIPNLGIPAEIYDNIAGPGNLFWTGFASAINSGISGLRGPSQIVTATAGVSSATPTVATTTLSGGADGVSGVATQQLVGVDTAPRKGMYALRGQQCQIVNLTDAWDDTYWSAMSAFADSEACIVGTSTPIGDTISAAVAALSSEGVDDYNFKLLLGDWVYWQDQVNGVTRLLAPATFWAGLRAATPPQNSTLNRAVQAVVGTQKSTSGASYSTADIAALVQGRVDVICNPVPGGSYFGPRIGRNSSSNGATRGENYTMLTNFIVASLKPVVGKVVGQLQNPTQRRQAKSMLDDFFSGLASEGVIGTADGSQPWQVTLNSTNNPPSQVAAGIETIAIKVIYQSVIEFLIVNLEGGQTVTIESSGAQLLSNAA
jgi:hypothetical protein